MYTNIVLSEEQWGRLLKIYEKANPERYPDPSFMIDDAIDAYDRDVSYDVKAEKEMED